MDSSPFGRPNFQPWTSRCRVWSPRHFSKLFTVGRHLHVPWQVIKLKKSLHDIINQALKNPGFLVVVSHPRHNAVISAYTANTASDLPKVGDGCLESQNKWHSNIRCFEFIFDVRIFELSAVKYWYIPNLEEVMSWCHNDREFWPRFLVQGFELYDTDMQTILAQITFRNYDRSGDVCIQAGWYYANLQVDEQWCINSVYQSGTESI